ncbi:MAG: hypothetical protein AB201_01380 [Parcubacteria bacterium C7867-006]|nr:MAG: hypothetical protein AB201_01380 [Parcubacteria bacterium C7867-006]
MFTIDYTHIYMYNWNQSSHSDYTRKLSRKECMKIAFLRHSLTLLADDDSSRVLSPEGIELARQKRAANGNPEFDVIVHSRKIRTRQTGLIYAGKEDDPNVKTYAVPQLWMLDYYGSTRVIDAAYDRFGNSGVRSYFDHCSEAMYEFANGATDALIPRFMHYSERGMKNVLVVGHAILTQAICVNLIGDGPLPADLLDDVLGECEGYEFAFDINHYKFEFVGLLK